MEARAKCIWHIVLCVTSVELATAQNESHHAFTISALARQTENKGHYVYDSGSPVYVADLQTFAGPKLAYTYALSSQLAIEASAAYLFGRQQQVPQNGGEQVLAHLGLQAALPLGHSRFAVIGQVAPGISSFSTAIRSQTLTLVGSPSSIYSYSGVPNYGRITHFSLEGGLALSMRVANHSSILVSAGQELLLQGDRRQTLPGNSFSTVLERAAVEDHRTFTVGVRRSFGRELRPKTAAYDTREMPSSELVLAYALQPAIQRSQFDLGLDSGVALTASHFFTSWLAIDSTFLLRSGNGTATFQDGGPQVQFVAGLKAGIRHDRWGMFAKARPGMIADLHVLADTGNVPPPTSPAEHFGGDVGAVIEAYPTAHTLLRIDLAELVTQYASVRPKAGYGTNFLPSDTTVSPQFLLGVGWRF